MQPQARMATEEEKGAGSGLSSPFPQPGCWKPSPSIKAAALDFHERYRLPRALSALILSQGPAACDVPDVSKELLCFLSAFCTVSEPFC